MTEITVTLDATETQCMAYVAYSTSDWVTNAVKERARLAGDEIVKLYVDTAMAEGVTIPSTRSEIISDAFSRGWVQSAASASDAAEAAADVAAEPQE